MKSMVMLVILVALPVWAGPAEQITPQGLDEKGRQFNVGTGTAQYNKLVEAMNAKQRVYQKRFAEPEPTPLIFGLCLNGPAQTFPTAFKALPPLRELSSGVDRPITAALPTTCPPAAKK